MGQSEIRDRVEVALTSGIEHDVFGPLQDQLPDIADKLFRTSLQDIHINAVYPITALTAEKNGDGRYRHR